VIGVKVQLAGVDECVVVPQHIVAPDVLRCRPEVIDGVLIIYADGDKIAEFSAGSWRYFHLTSMRQECFREQKPIQPHEKGCRNVGQLVRGPKDPVELIYMCVPECEARANGSLQFEPTSMSGDIEYFHIREGGHPLTGSKLTGSKEPL